MAKKYATPDEIQTWVRVVVANSVADHIKGLLLAGYSRQQIETIMPDVHAQARAAYKDLMHMLGQEDTTLPMLH